MQSIALFFAIVAGILISACMVANIATAVIAATDKWFVRCENCHEYSNTTEQQKCTENCCTECDKKDQAFFYIFRIYSVLFCLLAIVAEFPFKAFRAAFRVLSWYWGRGLLQIWIGFLTVTGNVSPKDADAAWWCSVAGYALMIMGGIHLVLTCICFKDKSSSRDDEEFERRGKKDYDRDDDRGYDRVGGGGDRGGGGGGYSSYGGTDGGGASSGGGGGKKQVYLI
jgi:uncharacterized membrane protein YgcG